MITEQQVMEALKQCYDPEIPVNIVDLGLIYGVEIQESDVRVKMTLTAQGCPAHAMISEQVREKLMGIPGIGKAEVEITWDPPWTPDRLSEAAKKQLGWG